MFSTPSINTIDLIASSYCSLVANIVLLFPDLSIPYPRCFCPGILVTLYSSTTPCFVLSVTERFLTSLALLPIFSVEAPAARIALISSVDSACMSSIAVSITLAGRSLRVDSAFIRLSVRSLKSTSSRTFSLAAILFTCFLKDVKSLYVLTRASLPGTRLAIENVTSPARGLRNISAS